MSDQVFYVYQKPGFPALTDEKVYASVLIR